MGDEAAMALRFSCQLRKCLFDEGSHNMIGAAAESNTGDIHFLLGDANSKKVEAFSSVIYEDAPEEYLWARGCHLRCGMTFMLPVYVPVDKTSDLEEVFSLLTAAVAGFKDPHAAFLVEEANANLGEASHSIVLHGAELDFNASPPDQNSVHNCIESNEKALACFYFCLKRKSISSSYGEVYQNSKTILIS